MRIALLAPPWIPVPPPGYGGTESVVGQLADGLSGAGHEVILAAHPDSTSAGRLVEVRCRLAGGAGDLTDEINFTRAAWRQLQLQAPDVVHEHTAGGADVDAGSIPRVATMHGPCDERLGPVYRQLGQRSAIVAISHSQANLATGVPVAKVIHHGLDPDAFPVGQGTGGFLLHLGRMSPTKGIDSAIRVAERAGVDLVIASKIREPDEVEYFNQVIRPMLGRRVTFHGETQGPEKLQLLGDAMALLNPIRWPEPFGMVMIEAMACGTPVIATPCGAAPEIVEHEKTGYICTDEPAMIGAVQRLADLDRRACRRRVELHFSTARMVEAHIELYERVARLERQPEHGQPAAYDRVDVVDVTGESAAV